MGITITRRTFMKVAAATGAAAALSSTSAMTALAATEEPQGADVKRVRTCCRGCGKMECGVWVTVANGRAVKIEGDESAFQSQGNCCTKSQASLQACYHPSRLYHPMKRTNEKGEGDPGWVRITWDEAYQIMHEKFTELANKYDGSSMFGMGGTSRIWSMAPYGALGTAMGGSNNKYTPNQVCKGPRWYATGMVSSNAFSFMATVDRPRVYVQWGGSGELSNYDDSCRTVVDCASTADTYISVDPRKTNVGHEADIWNNVFPGTDAVLALSWASVIIENDLYDPIYVKKWMDAPFLVCQDIEPSGWTLPGRSSYDIKTRLLKESDVQEGGSPQRFMVWDSIGNRLTYFDSETGLWEGETWTPTTEGREAQQQLPPGVAQGFVPEVSGFTVEDGFATEIDPAIFGEFEVTLKDGRTSTVRPVWEYYREVCAEYAPEKATEICGVAPEKIEAAAKAYATRVDPSTGYGNGGIQYMLAVEHAGNCVQNCRTIDALTAITGNYDTPAGMRGPTTFNFDGELVGSMPDVFGAGPRSDLPQIGKGKFPLYDTYAPQWSDAETLMEAAHTGEPYPIVGGFCMSGDFMSMGNSLYNWEALKGFDFWVVADLWLTPTAGAADIVLPVWHWLEVNSPRKSQGSSGAAGATCRAVEPPADCRWDPVITIGLFKVQGIPWSPGEGDEQWPDWEGVCDSVLRGTGKTWAQFAEDFQKDGWIDCKKENPEDWGMYRRYQTGALNSGKPGYPTPSGKHELWSLVMESTYEDGRYNLPTFIDPPQSIRSKPELYNDYPYTMTTGRRIPVYFHSEHRQLPWCREHWTCPRVEINPNMAKRLGIEQGDWCWIESPSGKIRQVADLYYGIQDGVINCEHQWWLPEINAAGRGFELVGINCLVDRTAQDPCVGTSNLRAYPVNIYKATPENCPNGNVIPIGYDGQEMIHDSSDPRLKEWLPDYEIRKEA
ncbi:molybdopterin-containing oxidoreductase family protein [Parvibacter caecicola]|uniref:molybdopterin-containing oxidoreductase family protein n=1 Tax=Parvibacter caecicola TaxID=747645 RepID=UPI00248AC690|nr:molybdopterin-dependent oxidoreductase [Parvibacter caecicola]